MRILAVDGNSIMNRAFYGIRFLTNSKGFPTNALTGFLNIWLKEIEAVQPDCAVAAFDLKAPTFRHKAAASYKATRKGMPEELAVQMPKIKEILTAMGVRVLEVEGFEADDILGTAARIFSGAGDECFIVTGDRDSLQLVRENVTVRLATTKETVIYTPEKIHEVYGITPSALIEVKALMGDTSDNISGVPGIGEKTALKLIQQYGTVENLYANLPDAALTANVKSKLESGRELAEQSRFLGTICTQVPMDENQAGYKIMPQDNETLRGLLGELEMVKLAERLNTGAVTVLPEKTKSTEPLAAYEIQPLRAEMISSLTAQAQTYFVREETGFAVVFDCVIYMGAADALFLDYLETPCEKFCFDAKAAYLLALQSGRRVENLKFSCDLAGYLLNSQAADYTVENLCAAHGVQYRSDCTFHADAASLPALCGVLSAKITDTGMEKLLYEVELPLCEVLASMEWLGVRADTDGIRSFGEQLVRDIATIEGQIYALAGHEFNIGSPKQLGTVLFEELGLPAKKKTKSGYSTNAEVLEELSDYHAIVPLVLEYRTLTKLNSTYVEGLLKAVGADGRVHSVFKQTETRTGRISSTEPNMQNIPVRKELGRNMRKFFIAAEGCTLVDADYSQIELRVLASVCGDAHMQEAFLQGRDIHKSTAAQVFGMPEDYVTHEMRSAAKAVNFGIIYGIGPFSLSKDIGVTVARAKEYIKNYLDNFPNVAKFMEETVAGGVKNGYVTTMFGRRRYIPELSATNKNVQAFGKRAAMNAPIQGAAADIIKIAMVRVYRRLQSEKLDARLILQVHDELIVEAAQDCAEAACRVVQEEMEHAAALAVPLTADVHTGQSWYDAKG